MKNQFYFSFILFILFMSICNRANAQAPAWLLASDFGSTGNDYAAGSTVDPAGNFYSTGTFLASMDVDPGPETRTLTSAGLSDVFVNKYDASGNLAWAVSFGGAADDFAGSMAVDAGSGSIYLTGFFQGKVDFDPGVGTVYLSSTGASDSYIVKLDSSGNLVWAKSLGGPTDDLGIWVTVADPGSDDIYFTGTYLGTLDFDPDTANAVNLTSKGVTDIYVLKLDGDGNFLWARSMGGLATDNGLAMAVDPAGSGDVITTGRFGGTTVDFNPDPAETFNLTNVGNQSAFISRLDKDGNFVWAKAITGPKNVYGNSIAIAPDGSGDIYATGLYNGVVDFDPGSGTTELPDMGFDGFIVKFDEQGNFEWANAVGGTGFDRGVSLVMDNQGTGDFFLGGSFEFTADLDPGSETFTLTSAGDDDIFIARYDDAGSFKWAKSVGGELGDYMTPLSQDAEGHLFLGGQFGSSEISFDSITLTNTTSNANSDIFFAKLENSFPSAVIQSSRVVANIFPNPFSDVLTIELEDTYYQQALLTCMNARGEIIFSKEKHEWINGNAIDTKALIPGVYFIELKAEGQSYVIKVIKQ